MAPVSHKDCIRFNPHGAYYHELTCLYPSLAPFYHPLETSESGLPSQLHRALSFSKTHYLLPYLICLLYLLSIPLLRNRFPPNLRLPRLLACWNLLLSAFSAAGFARTAPHLLQQLLTLDAPVTTAAVPFLGLPGLLCRPPHEWGSGSTGVWVQLFIFSKVPELLDTLFLLAHGKPVIFLHWYHHVTVLLFCWHSYAHENPSGLFFCVMNYFVHAIMYFYYFLMAVKRKPRFFKGVYVTVLQISQMVVGIYICALSYQAYFRAQREGVECAIHRENLVAGTVMYASYFALFMHFFLGRYCAKPGTKPVARKPHARRGTVTGKNGFGNGRPSALDKLD